MARIKNKNRSELEHLNGLIRQLKKQVKKLTKDNNQLRKELNRTTPPNIVEEEVEVTSSSNERCPECGSSTNTIDLGTRSLIACNECEYRKVIKC